MKRPIAWHKASLENMTLFSIRLERELKAIQEHYDRLVADIRFLMEQVYTAEAEGRDGFDADKYLRSRKP